jgi:hypothetical protein
MTAIRCELISDTARAGDLTASGTTDLCRRLLAAGADQNAGFSVSGTERLHFESNQSGQARN